MATQMIVRVNPELKNKVNNLAKAEGKNISEVVRELLEDYVRDHDIGFYIDDLWERVGVKLKSRGHDPKDIQRVIRRCENKEVIKVVLDTNVFVSSFLGGNPRKIVHLWKTGEVTLCLSRPIIDEYIEVLRRLGLQDERELGELLGLFARAFHVVFTAKTQALHVVEDDPDDREFIECAVAFEG